ncbi:MAG: hypothetical protein IMZ53_04190 [Thermoplasmata archaeon]|nr:hypothetical protein [Thermoplasmata archaeon]
MERIALISLDKSTMPGIRSSKRAPNEYGSHRRRIPRGYHAGTMSRKDTGMIYPAGTMCFAMPSTPALHQTQCDASV